MLTSIGLYVLFFASVVRESDSNSLIHSPQLGHLAASFLIFDLQYGHPVMVFET
jgi:hypothetical protein